MKPVLFFSALIILVACARTKSPADTRDQLKSAMISFLATEKDTTRAKFEILDVYYFEEKKSYTCEFKVRMRIPDAHIDTIGKMRALISRDFKTVTRKW